MHLGRFALHLCASASSASASSDFDFVGSCRKVCSRPLSLALRRGLTVSLSVLHFLTPILHTLWSGSVIPLLLLICLPSPQAKLILLLHRLAAVRSRPHPRWQYVLRTALRRPKTASLRPPRNAHNRVCHRKTASKSGNRRFPVLLRLSIQLPCALIASLLIGLDPGRLLQGGPATSWLNSVLDHHPWRGPPCPKVILRNGRREAVATLLAIHLRTVCGC